ncbi:hypothetical protein [Chakrabartyella piscis]|uniref:hypothetical protein n=1 Tax=Chakrabartyella piscis TaxID=2918914 RepID=UPI00295880BF|nr:hypothetical protein [Chakrabartyella piscis]
MNKSAILFRDAYNKAIHDSAVHVLQRMPGFENMDEHKCIQQFKAKFWQNSYQIRTNKKSFELIAVMITNAEIDGFPTNEVYENYTYHCERLKIPPLVIGEFSKIVRNYFGYKVADKRVPRLKSKKCRVFVKKLGVLPSANNR